MYVRYFRDKIVDDPYPMYQELSELKEEPGEAIEAWLQTIEYEQYPSERFTVQDSYNDEDIQLDIIDYICQETYDYFAEIVYRAYDEEETLSHTKLHSFFLACVQNSRRKKGLK